MEAQQYKKDRESVMIVHKILEIRPNSHEIFKMQRERERLDNPIIHKNNNWKM